MELDRLVWANANTFGVCDPQLVTLNPPRDSFRAAAVMVRKRVAPGKRHSWFISSVFYKTLTRSHHDTHSSRSPKGHYIFIKSEYLQSMDAAMLSRAALELEDLRSSTEHIGQNFPNACCRLLKSIPGNSACADCGSRNPDWASISYGSLICLHCSGRHRSYGVGVSVVRSVHMDAWTHSQVLAMLEGGNDQLKQFFDRHQLGSTSSMCPKRYHTKAAHFYKTHLATHVRQVSDRGLYEGREASRGRETSTGEAQACSSSIQKRPNQVSQRSVTAQ